MKPLMQELLEQNRQLVVVATMRGEISLEPAMISGRVGGHGSWSQSRGWDFQVRISNLMILMINIY